MRFRYLVGLFLIIVLAVGVFFVFRIDEVGQVGVEEVTFEEVVTGSVVLDEFEEIVEDENEIDSPVIPTEVEESLEADATELYTSDSIEPDSEIPNQINLAVPFTSQAPHANWELPYQEACEEVSVYMVWLYFEGYASGVIEADLADEAILDLVDYQNTTIGDYLDTTAQQTADFAQAFYGMNTIVVQNPTVEEIKEQLAQGYPVIVPTAGQELGNPFFSGEGPPYHMLVLRGYTQTQWIANDPGTRRGEAYLYDIDVIMNAMGDWNDGDPASGEKVVIFTNP